jgi:hypothetical protein
MLVLLTTTAGCVTTVPMRADLPSQSYVDVPVPASVPFGLFNYKDAKTLIPIYGDIKRVQAQVARNQLDAEMRAQGFDAGKELQRLLVARLTARRVQSRPLTAERPHDKMPPRVDLASLPLQDDTWAVLDARITGVSLMSDMSGEFRPQVALLVQLIEARTKRLLYDNRFIYNGRAAKAVRIPYDPGAQWTDIEAIRNDLPGVRAAIVAALDKMAELIAADLSSKR